MFLRKWPHCNTLNQKPVGHLTFIAPTVILDPSIDHPRFITEPHSTILSILGPPRGHQSGLLKCGWYYLARSFANLQQTVHLPRFLLAIHLLVSCTLWPSPCKEPPSMRLPLLILFTQQSGPSSPPSSHQEAPLHFMTLRLRVGICLAHAVKLHNWHQSLNSIMTPLLPRCIYLCKTWFPPLIQCLSWGQELCLI